MCRYLSISSYIITSLNNEQGSCTTNVMSKAPFLPKARQNKCDQYQCLIEYMNITQNLLFTTFYLLHQKQKVVCQNTNNKYHKYFIK